jgi:hypothetical protein
MPYVLGGKRGAPRERDARDLRVTHDRRARQKPAAMSMLQCSNRSTVAAQKFVTQ